jgi:nucleolar pre-ribosomal-associated protein 2
VRARAEWVLRWILEKLKDGAEAGVQARANPRAWCLLDWMIYLLPTSPCATQLRDAGFLGVLEQVLQENFEKDGTVQPVPNQKDGSVQPGSNLREKTLRDSSESSETVQEDRTVSRKRKRPSSGTTPSKKQAIQSDGLEKLFTAIAQVVASICAKARSRGVGEDLMHTEHMRMTLRTESAQAARILKYWLMAVRRFLSAASQSGNAPPNALLDLSAVMEIWELRNIESDDSTGASADQFSTECLIPVLLLYDGLQNRADQANLDQDADSVHQRTIQGLERLLARHLFVPSRAAFLTTRANKTPKKTDAEPEAIEALASNLEPLGAKLLQAAQIHDTSSPIPPYFLSLFASVPLLLDMAIRFSPLRTAKSRSAEQPWIQRVFVSLAHCVGCPLKAPEFPVPEASLHALEKALGVLTLRNVTIDIGVLKDLFRFYSGVRSFSKQAGPVHWSLIAALVKLNPDMFVPRTSSSTSTPDGGVEDITTLLFDQITRTQSEREEIAAGYSFSLQDQVAADAFKGDVIISIIIPIMSAFARNRDLLGFIQRWDVQLCLQAIDSNSGIFELKRSVWVGHNMIVEMGRLFEQTLAQRQKLKLFRDHVERIIPPKRSQLRPDISDQEKEHFAKATSSAVILQMMLTSIDSDETTELLEPQLLILFSHVTELLQNDEGAVITNPADRWFTLCRLLNILWPIHFHASRQAQEHVLRPIFETALKEIYTSQAKIDEPDFDLSTRGPVLLFLLCVCDHLRTVSGWEELLAETIPGIIDGLTSNDLLGLSDNLCTEYVQLLEYLEPDKRESQLKSLLTKVSVLGDENRHQFVSVLSQSLFCSASTGLRDAYAGALVTALGEFPKPSIPLAIVETALVQIRPSALSRERREVALDSITEILTSKPQNVDLFLSVMVTLMEVPNATAKVSSNGSALFDIAASVHDKNLESPDTLQLFQELVRLTLGHILPNKDQTQNKQYFEKFESKLASITKKPKHCYPARLAILKATVLVPKADALLPVDQYVAFLAGCLSNADPSVENYVVDAFNEIPLSVLEQDADLLEVAQASIRSWLVTKLDLESLSNLSDEIFATAPMETWIRVQTLMARYQLYPDAAWFLQLSTKILKQTMAVVKEREHLNSVLISVNDVISGLSIVDKLDLIHPLLQAENKDSNDPWHRILPVLISSLDDRLLDEAEQKQQQLSILPKLSNLASKTSSIAVFSACFDTIDTILTSKHSLTSQHSLEALLTTLVKLTSRNSPFLPSTHASQIYTRLCETARYILLLHRSRLGGRFHLLLPLLQNLLFCLFIPNAGRVSILPPWLKPTTSATTPIRLSPTNASSFTRLLSTLCSPTHSSVAKAHHRPGTASTSTRTTLNDPVKAAREYASHYIYPFLGSFCRFTLNGRLEPGVRDKLMLGLWECVGVARLDREALDALFAGLDKGSRDVWRGVWEEYCRVNGREG